MIEPAEICRLDDRLLSRISRGDRLGAVAISAALTITLGAGAYGFAFGLWRAFAQAAYSAVKLPALLLSVAACTLGLSVMLASVLRSRLSIRQTAVSILLSLSVAAAVLGAMAPISVLLALVAPPPDPSVVGLAIDDPRLLPSLTVARTQLLLHVAVIACAGIVGVVRLRGLLARLGLAPIVLRRVLVSFLALQFVAGVELSWLLRPFFGRPHLPPTFSCDKLLEGNFFQELAVSLVPVFGRASGLVLGLVFGVAALVAIVVLSRRAPALAAADVPLSMIAAVSAKGAEVHLTLRPDHTLTGDVVRIACENPSAARVLAARIEAERTALRDGPFRSTIVAPADTTRA